MTESAKKYNFFYHFLFLSAYFVCSPPPFRPSPFLILSLQFFFRSFSLPSCLSLFITCFYRCVSLPPVSSFLFLCHLFYCIRFLFCILFFLHVSFPLSVFQSLLRSILPHFPIYFSVFLSLFYLYHRIPAPSLFRSFLLYWFILSLFPCFFFSQQIYQEQTVNS